MHDLIISVSKNQLRLSLATKEGVVYAAADLPDNIVSDTHINGIETFIDLFNSTFSQLGNFNKDKLKVTFLVEPSDVIYKFVTIDKDADDIDEAIISSVKSKLDNVSIDDLYFSYQKIAPFVYQFIAIKKGFLEGYLELSNRLGISLDAVIPWVLVLPKYLDTNDPCVFVLKTQKRQIVALAELNGIYFCEALDNDTSLEQLQFLVQKLSVYKRSDPIKNIYALDKGDINLGNDFKVTSLQELLNIENLESGFETHFLIRSFFDKRPNSFSPQLNLLNSLPLPVVKEKNRSLVYVGVAGLLAFLLVGGMFAFIRSRSAGDIKGDVAMVDEQNPVVLSENTNAPEEVSVTTEDTNSDEEVPEALSPSELKVRIENGAGVPGVAGDMQTYLEEKGYTVVSIGNAEIQGREDTLLKFKASSTKYKDLLTNDMSDYQVVVEDGLEESSEYDVLIVVGLN